MSRRRNFLWTWSTFKLMFHSWKFFAVLESLYTNLLVWCVAIYVGIKSRCGPVTLKDSDIHFHLFGVEFGIVSFYKSFRKPCNLDLPYCLWLLIGLNAAARQDPKYNSWWFEVNGVFWFTFCRILTEKHKQQKKDILNKQQYFFRTSSISFWV